MRKQNGHDAGAHSGRTAQQPESPGASVQNFACIHRKQRYCATEQNCKHVQRNRAQHNLLPPDISEPSQHRVPCNWLPSRRPALGINLQCGEHCSTSSQHRACVHCRGTAKECVYDPTCRRPQNRRTLKYARVPRHCIWKMLFRDQLRQECAAHRPIERANNAEKNHDRINRMHRPAVVPGRSEQQTRGQRESCVADCQKASAVETIGRVTRRQEEHNARQELRKAD